jgi:flagellar hook-associated protein 2
MPTSGTPHTGTIRIKQGMLNDLISMIDVDFLDPDSGATDTRKGTLSVLQSQYKQVIANINEKISKEDTRITTWRSRMDLRYARLEATLQLYANLLKQVESQVASLTTSSES